MKYFITLFPYNIHRRFPQPLADSIINAFYDVIPVYKADHIRYRLKYIFKFLLCKSYLFIELCTFYSRCNMIRKSRQESQILFGNRLFVEIVVNPKDTFYLIP